MSAVKKERTPEQIEAAKARMAHARAKKVAKPELVEHESAIPADELEGLTAKDCCDSCCLANCAITHDALCGHPLKSGLQSTYMLKPDVVARYQKAKKILAHAKIDAA